jgi:hypothetical protein
MNIVYGNFGVICMDSSRIRAHALCYGISLETWQESKVEGYNNKGGTSKCRATIIAFKHYNTFFNLADIMKRNVLKEY